MAQGITPEDERRCDGLSHRGRTSRARPRTSTRPPVLKPFTALLLRIRHRSGTHAPSDPPRQPSLMARRSTAPPLRLRLRATVPPCLCALLLIKARRYSKGHKAEEPPHLARNVQQLCLLAHQPAQLRSEFLSTATARRGFYLRQQCGFRPISSSCATHLDLVLQRAVLLGDRPQSQQLVACRAPSAED